MPLTALVMAVVLAAAPADKDAVAKARELYNQGDYAGAIALAVTATSDPSQADAAALVIARSHLERYREGQNADDLIQGRTALQSIEPSRLAERDRREYLVGLGESQFFDGRLGSAAELFESAFDADGTTGDERLLDWWATALDRLAQQDQSKHPVYERILTRMEQDLRRRPDSIVAPYWIVVALRAMGDLDRAWEAAQAAWLRAGLGGLNANHLRSELDRFVAEVLIPERAAHSAASGTPITEASMREEWSTLRTQWGAPPVPAPSEGR